MEKQEIKSNLLSIDILRFFAAFSVYYYHQHLGELLAKFTHLSFLEYTDILGATYAVPLFFLLSGFCIHLSNIKKIQRRRNLNLKIYYLNRFWRIYPPYLFALLFSMSVCFITEPKSIITLKDFFNHFFVLQGFSEASFNSINVVLWTISVELAFYLVYPLFYFIQLKWSSLYALFFSAIISIISILYFQFQNTNLSFPQRYFFTNLWFAWCFGAWLCDLYANKPNFFNSLNWKIIITLIFSLFIATLFFNWHNDILTKYIIYIIVWSPLLIGFIHYEQKLIAHKKWLKIPLALGVSSYSLYLLHEPLILLKNNTIHSIFGSNFQLPLMILGIFMVPIICYWSYIIIERPFMTFRKNIAKPTISLLNKDLNK